MHMSTFEVAANDFFFHEQEVADLRLRLFSPGRLQ